MVGVIVGVVNCIICISKYCDVNLCIYVYRHRVHREKSTIVG
jgi:hypothetical protein